MVRKLSLYLSLLLVAILFGSGCVVNRATATPDPTAHLADIKSIFVTKLAADSRGVNLLIVDKLKGGVSIGRSFSPLVCIVNVKRSHEKKENRIYYCRIKK